MHTRLMTGAVGLTLALTLGAVLLGPDGSAQAQQNPPGQGQGAGRGAGGGRGFSLPPLLMETDAFPDGGIVPQKYTGRGGVQPSFKFSNAPAGTVSYAIIFHDLDVALKGDTGGCSALDRVEHSGIGQRDSRRQAAARLGAGQQHHRPAELHGPGRAGRTAVPPLRVRALCAEREPRAAGDGEP